MDNTRVFKMAFASVYPHYVAKAEKKGRTKAELHTIIHWLTGYDEPALQQLIEKRVDFQTFFANAPPHQPQRQQDHRRHLRLPRRRDRRPPHAADPLPGQTGR